MKTGNKMLALAGKLSGYTAEVILAGMCNEFLPKRELQKVDSEHTAIKRRVNGVVVNTYSFQG